MNYDAAGWLTTAAITTTKYHIKPQLTLNFYHASIITQGFIQINKIFV